MVKYRKIQKYQLSYCTLQCYAIIEPKKHKFQVSECLMHIKKFALKNMLKKMTCILKFVNFLQRNMKSTIPK